MKRSEIKTGTMPTRRAKPLVGPRFILPDLISAACAKETPGHCYNCTMLRCQCECHRRGEK